MKTHLIAAGQIPEADWVAFGRLRSLSAEYDNPLFHPQYARTISELRTDTYVLVAEDRDGLAGFWPMHCSNGWARPIGGPFSDWHGPVLRPDVTADLETLVDAAGLRGMTVHGMSLDRTRVISPLELADVHVTDLSCGWESFMAGQTEQHARFFKKHFRLERKLHREFSDVEFRFDDDDDASLERLLQIKSEQYRASGRHDVLASPWAQPFIELLRQGHPDQTYARLSSLYVDGQLAAAELNLQSGSYLHGWLAGFDRAFERYSPGHLIVRLILESMAETGMTFYDAGIGHGHYKKYFANMTRTAGAGVIRSHRRRLGPNELLSLGWRLSERRAPRQVKATLGKIRRRSDQILASELNFSDRMRGFWRAAVDSRGITP